MNPSAESSVVELNEARRRMRRMTRRSFAAGGVAALVGAAGLSWLHSAELDDDVPWPLRRALEFNERVARGFFSRARLAPEFPVALARMPRANGNIGLAAAVKPREWKLAVATEAVG